jgi:fumarate hydratase class II
MQGEHMNATRPERDTMGEIDVPADKLWGAQTERSRRYFAIGTERFPAEFIHALVLVKKACARSNARLGVLPEHLATLIEKACDEILDGAHLDNFPLSVWQTGSGTQTNMNANEVIANRANQMAGSVLGARSPVHPNDHVNCSQSSNDVFPTAMHVATVMTISDRLQPALEQLIGALAEKSSLWDDFIKIGRTHLMDAVPMTVGQELSAFVDQLRQAETAIGFALEKLRALAIGGSAVGTGLNTPPRFAETVVRHLSDLAEEEFYTAPNRFAALAGHDALLQCSSALRQLATVLFKMANDVRWLASGPRAGLGELLLPANEPGSSIMPGKVNPTQCEAMTMVAVQVMGLDSAIAMACANGQLQLNVFKPMIIHNILTMLRLLADAMDSFTEHLVEGLAINEFQLERNVQSSLMLATALTPHIGYDRAAEVAKYAQKHDVSLIEAGERLGYFDADEFYAWVDPLAMAKPHDGA